jgi:phytoene synthase
MQLTNIARDVGEDAAAGRVYLPLAWFDEAGFPVERFLDAPSAAPPVRRMVRRLLAEADRLYFRAEAGIARLPLDCRPGIWAARSIYAAIGRDVARHDHDSVTRRARTGRAQKLGGLAFGGVWTATGLLMPRPVELHARPEAQVAFLVDAAARGRPARETWAEGRSGALVSALIALESRDRAHRATLIGGGRSTT